MTHEEAKTIFEAKGKFIYDGRQLELQYAENPRGPDVPCYLGSGPGVVQLDHEPSPGELEAILKKVAENPPSNLGGGLVLMDDVDKAIHWLLTGEAE